MSIDSQEATVSLLGYVRAVFIRFRLTTVLQKGMLEAAQHVRNVFRDPRTLSRALRTIQIVELSNGQYIRIGLKGAFERRPS